MQSIIGLEIQHKDGARGVIVDIVRNRSGYYSVRFDDGVTVAQSEKNLFIGDTPLSVVIKDSSLIEVKKSSNDGTICNISRGITNKRIVDSILGNTPITLITGEAGTGKSTLIDELRKKLPGNTAVVAFTGVAAQLISGETIHSFFGFPITVLPIKTKGDPRNREKIYKLSHLVIDEVSMLRADVLDAICFTLAEYGPHKNQQLGGVKLILVGDFMQLDPVLESDDKARKYFYSKYYSSFFFEAQIFQNVDVAFHVLSHKYRQEEDAEFGEILSRMRIGQTTATDINRINQTVDSSGQSNLRNEATWLTNTNDRVEEINQHKLDKLTGPSRSFHASITGDFLPQNYPTAVDLVLKKKAQVMFIRNDTEKIRRWYNGSIATITDLYENSIELLIHRNGLSVSIQRSVWDAYKYFYNKEKDTLDCISIGIFEQFPVSLAWATTIHKAQGKTLETIFLDLPIDYRVMPSQLYVALSRAKSMKRVGISRPVTLNDVQVNKRALQAWKLTTENDGTITKFHLPKTIKESNEIENISDTETSSDNSVMQFVQAAIDNNDRLFMDYISKTGRKWRVVEPLEWLQNGVLFEAYCEENDENRSFRVDRIHSVKKL
jgi:ATP-dependent exoDNAse (exonuclease V) alpha subunit